MATEIIMPKLGMSMEEGKIIKWLKKEGEEIEVGEPLLEIETDKVTMEVEAPVSGVLLKVMRGDGEVVPVTETIGYIGEPGEELVGVRDGQPGENQQEAKGGEIEDRVPALSAEKPLAMDIDKVPATPLARTMAAQKGLDLKTIKGTGSRGEIKARDMEKGKAISPTPLARAIAKAENIDLSTLRGSGLGGRITKEDVLKGLKTEEETGKTTQKTEEPTRKKLEGMRKIIGQRMLQSHLQAPPVTQHTKADVTELVALRNRLNEALDIRVSLNDLALKATAMALREHLEMNVSIEGDELVYHQEINLGMAVALEEGLIVPVIRNADRLSLVEISMIAKDLATRSREGKLGPDEYTGGTFTVSNMGQYDLFAFTPILNPPEAGILGVCSIEEQLRMMNGNIEVRSMMGLSLTFDHRAIDGVQSAVVLKRITSLLERPLEILMH